MSRLLVSLFFLSFASAQVIPNRYIVELEGEPAVTLAAKDKSLAAHRTAVRDAQSHIREAVEGLEGRVFDSVDTVANALMVRIADDKAHVLESIPGVRRVTPVHTYKMSLDHALAVHKVPDAWKIVGEDRAGAGAKIAIIDSGIEIEHPGMQDSSLTAPAGFPKTNADTDTQFTNSKVIVARSYARFFENLDDDQSSRDRVGHGTAVAMAAAGVRNTGPNGPIVGVAPKAFLGAYKVFGSSGVNNGAPGDGLLKALDDAVADGMDVISMSLGDARAARLDEDPIVAAVERTVAARVIVVIAAGNDGPEFNTMQSPGNSPNAITVGGSGNERVFFTSAQIEGVGEFIMYTGSGATDLEPVSGPLFDVSTLDQDGLGCLPFPLNSLKDKVALIQRGTCLFEEKLDNVQRAGAIAGLIYTDDRAARPMNTGANKLPAGMLFTRAQGLEIKRRLAEGSLRATLRFKPGPVPFPSDRIYLFSARGPSVDESIKPDLVAVGDWFYTAAQRTVPEGEVYDESGYVVTEGTSFSTPLVAGAAAVLKAARPGLTVAQYRSLLINSSTPVTRAKIMDQGAGMLNLEAAVRSTLAVAPTSLSLRTGGDPNISRTLTLSNFGTTSGTYTLAVSSLTGSAKPSLSTDSVTIAPGANTTVTVRFAGTALTPGAYEGFVTITDAAGAVSRVPYWYAVPDTIADGVSFLHITFEGQRGSLLRGALVIRVTDAAGVLLTNVTPKVTVKDGGGSVVDVQSIHNRVPGAYSVTLRLGPRSGDNTFTVEAGDVSIDVVITGN